MKRLFEHSPWHYSVLSESTAAIVDYSDIDDKIVIPSEIDGLTVTEIAGRAFSLNKNIVSVIIPDTVKKIGCFAFQGCCNLTELVIPETVEEIDETAFLKCAGLADKNGFLITNNVLCGYFGSDETVTIPDGIEIIGSWCFADNENIKEIILPDSICNIEDEAFKKCKNLQRIELPNSLKRIGAFTFDGCPCLTDIAIPENIETIRVAAFRGCAGLADENGFVIVNNVLYGYFGSDETVIVPYGIKVIDSDCFADNKNLRKVIFPDSIYSIGAFENCCRLTDIDIPETVEIIGDEAFRGCVGLADENGFVIVNNVLYDYFGGDETIFIPFGVERISSACFKDNKNLKEVVMPDSVYTIASGAFMSCRELQSVKLSNTLKEIGVSAFCNCRSLTDIVIPDSVEVIDHAAFQWCAGLANENGFAIVNNILYCYSGKSATVTVPNGIEKIESYCFDGNINIRNVILPDSVKKICHDAFCHCEYLQKVEISNAECEINNITFRGCPALNIEYKI